MDTASYIQASSAIRLSKMSCRACQRQLTDQAKPAAHLSCMLPREWSMSFFTLQRQPFSSRHIIPTRSNLTFQAFCMVGKDACQGSPTITFV